MISINIQINVAWCVFQYLVFDVIKRGVYGDMQVCKWNIFENVFDGRVRLFRKSYGRVESCTFFSQNISYWMSMIVNTS